MTERTYRVELEIKSKLTIEQLSDHFTIGWYGKYSSDKDRGKGIFQIIGALVSEERLQVKGER